jgi:DNA-binding transcriptional MerR regulator
MTPTPPAEPSAARYTLNELANLAGVTPRTVRYYLAQGLLPAVGVAGPGAKYDDGHLARLRLIKRLQREHQPLAEIRRRLEALDDQTILAVAAEPEPAPPAESALEYIRRVTAPAHRVSESAPGQVRCISRPRRLQSAALLAAEAPPSPLPSPRLDRAQWERVAITPDIELHIRRPLPRSTAKQVDRLIDIARDLLQEDAP